jgi:hypothetical protein
VRPAALLFDFKGALSDDEHIQCEIYREIEIHRLAAVDEIVRALNVELMHRLLG